MFEWRKEMNNLVVALLCFVSAWMPFSALAQTSYVCGEDTNNNGLLDTGEYSTCFDTIYGQHMCPKNIATCSLGADSVFVCPLGDYPCLPAGMGTIKCSSLTCYDKATVHVTEPPVNTASYTDDGTRDSGGNCLGNPMLFNGMVSTCRPAGTSTAWKNCCANSGGDIYIDSTGASVEDFLTNKAIVVAANAAYAAASAYASALSSGASSAEASSAAGTAAQDEMMGAFDPTSLAIAIAVYIIMSYVTKACPTDDIITSMKVDSGYCHYIGTHCVNKLFGSCTQSEKVYCCFNSKLGRILQEQGRPQLPSFSGWGTVDSPDCRGFTPEEFQALDFSKIDMSDYYAELRHKVDSEIQTNIKEGIDAFQSRGSGG